MRVSGLALANTIAFTLGFFILLVLSRKSLNNLDVLLIIKSVIKVIVSIIPASLVSVYYVYLIEDSWIYGGTLKNFGIIIIIAFFWLILTGLMYRLTKLDVVDFILKRRPKSE